MLLEPSKAEMVVMACIYLHNFIRKDETSKQNNVYHTPRLLDQELDGELIEGSWRREVGGIDFHR